MSAGMQAPTSLLSIGGFRRFTASQYHKLIDTGIIYEGEPVELLEGYLVEKGIRNPPHDGAITRLTNLLPPLLPPGWITRIQCPISLGPSEPEPDGAVVRGNYSSFDHRLPLAADFGIDIEVSDSTLSFDRGDKGRIYSRTGIPVYWIVNVAERQIEVYSDPDSASNPPAYLTRTDYKPGQDVPILLDGVAAGQIAATVSSPSQWKSE
ncbi:MAG TPA: Uma2 family endonuclease [Urbifossiella sp.]|nr:Uma2 family endonuclease [Urbifossiella sp.]